MIKVVFTAKFHQGRYRKPLPYDCIAT